MKKQIAAIWMALILFAATGCASAKPVSTGMFAGPTYTNDYFGLSLSVPADWHISTKDELKTAYSVGSELVGSDDKDIENTLELGKQKTLYLFSVSEYPLSHTGSFNSNASLICENLRLTGLKVKTARDYMLEALKQIDHTALKLEIGEIDEEKIGNTKVAMVYCELEMNGLKLRQRHIAAIKNKYALMLTLTYPRDASVEQLSELQAIVDSMSFK